MSMEREMLLAYQRRWQAVGQVEAAEQQTATIAERWQRLNSLLRLARSLGLPPSEDDVLIGPAQQRWNRLQSLYLAEQQEALR